MNDLCISGFGGCSSTSEEVEKAEEIRGRGKGREDGENGCSEKDTEVAV